MKVSRLKSLIVFFTLFNSIVFSQDSLITKIARQNMMTFSVKNHSFEGKGWDTIVSKVQKSDYILIGEDHFTNEIPFFFSALTNKVKFDNFFCEVDPYTAKIIESKIRNLPDKKLRNYVTDFGNVFSFYAFDPEFELLKKLVSSKTSIHGTDQILLVADRLVCNELKLKTKNAKARKIFENIETKSKSYFAEFLKDQNKPFFMKTVEFENEIEKLLLLNLSQEEKEKVEALQLSARIYKGEDSHHLRIQLMKSNLMKVYPEWKDKKNLFKFGANHLAKGESLMKIYDIGNLVNNVADSRFQKSLHIMIIGKSGTQASPFQGFPEQMVDENSGSFKTLKPFFDRITSDEWFCFDMHPLRTALENKKLIIKDVKLIRIINGYDYLVVIPKVTASKFPKTE
ncbi:hypothetical protein [Chryseobacterium sp. FH1]|uniref:hypothetical protein n=1 Tax=Chryseobacterium sp. FH1 TaxID=1233951 RepID=UPI0004E2B027|nr:hypothetical protein [Chryseobacterium sp. FH1]KFC19559.1 hypothetical protein IO90_09760 [Chryseobacterium sp. FH1]